MDWIQSVHIIMSRHDVLSPAVINKGYQVLLNRDKLVKILRKLTENFRRKFHRSHKI